MIKIRECGFTRPLDPVCILSGTPRLYSVKSEKHPTIYGEKQYEETRRAPSIIHFTGHVKPWTKKFQWYTKRYYDQYANRTVAFVVSTHSINIYLIRKLAEGLNMLNNEYFHGFRKISYLLVVAKTKQ